MNKNRPGQIGKHFPVFLIWAMDRRRRREQVILTECTKGQGTRALQKWLGKFYNLQAMHWDPALQGWWASRQRLFCVLCLKQEFGGKFQMVADLDFFQRIFRRRRPEGPGCSGSMFCVAPDADVLSRFQELAQGCEVPPPSSLASLPNGVWEQLLPPAKSARLQMYKQKFLLNCGHDLDALGGVDQDHVRS